VTIREQIKSAGGFDLQRILERFGAPTLIAVLLLTQLSPKIDRGIQIADHVDAELTYLAAVGCAPRVAVAGVQSDEPPATPLAPPPPLPSPVH
jgi:hypothetical protein